MPIKPVNLPADKSSALPEIPVTIPIGGEQGIVLQMPLPVTEGHAVKLADGIIPFQNLDLSQAELKLPLLESDTSVSAKPEQKRKILPPTDNTIRRIKDRLSKYEKIS